MHNSSALDLCGCTETSASVRLHCNLCNRYTVWVSRWSAKGGMCQWYLQQVGACAPPMSPSLQPLRARCDGRLKDMKRTLLDHLLPYAGASWLLAQRAGGAKPDVPCARAPAAVLSSKASGMRCEPLPDASTPQKHTYTKPQALHLMWVGAAAGGRPRCT